MNPDGLQTYFSTYMEQSKMLCVLRRTFSDKAYVVCTQTRPELLVSRKVLFLISRQTRIMQEGGQFFFVLFVD